MIVVEVLVLLFLGLVCGVFSTVLDVVVFGTASILSHFALWVLLIVLLAIHIDSCFRAIWWAVPYNVGYFAAYFLTTVASFEGYSKSLLMPLLGVALVSPLLTYTAWVAKREKNFYGRFLSALIVLGTLGSSYAINRQIGVFDVVVGILIALALFVMPVKRLKISPSVHPVTELDEEALPSAMRERVARESAEREPTIREARRTSEEGEKKQKKRRSLRRSLRRSSTSSSRPEPLQEQDSKRARNARRASSRLRRERRDESVERRARRSRERGPVQPQQDLNPPMPNPTLGNARVARRSNRSA